MITLPSKTVNQPVVFTAVISGTTVPGDLALYKDGVFVSSPGITFASLNGAGLANFTFTPASTGFYTLYGQTSVIGTVNVVSKTSETYLQNLEDEALGSWQWDKVAGTLTMLRQDGTSLANFTVVDSLTLSSRERV